MKKIVAILTLSLLFLLGSQTPAVQARSYDIANYDVLVEIAEDGSAAFTESITYDFDGAFNGVLFDLDYSPHLTPTEVSVKMAEEGAVAVAFAESDSRQAGTYEMLDTGTYLRFTVHNPMEDQVFTVNYSYRIPEMVTNYNDIAQFNRKVIGAGWEDVLQDVDIRIALPAAVEPGELRAWGHGHAAGQVAIVDDQFVTLTLDRNPAETFVEANVIFPTYVTWNNPNTVDDDRLDTIVGNEVALEKEAQSFNQAILIGGLAMGILGPVFALAVWLWLRKKNRQVNPNPYQEPDYVYDLPEDMSPAVMMKAIFKKTPDAVDVSATILDWVRKCYLKMEELELNDGFDYELTKVKEADASLLNHEKQLLSWLIAVAGNGQTVTFGEIEAIDEDTKTVKKFNEERQQWQRDVTMAAEPYLRSYKAPHAGLATGLTVMAVIANIVFLGLILVAVFAFQVTPYLLLLGVMGVVLGIYAAVYHSTHPALTPEGDKALKDWRAFKRMLEDVGDFKMQDIASVGMWDVYIVYATAFGIAQDVLEQMAIQYPTDYIQTYSTFYPYYYYHPGYIAVFNDRLSSGISSATPSSDTASGSGGGFSGGSSGGSGGGSGGGAF